MKRWLYSYRNVQGDPEDLEHTLLESSQVLLQRVTGSPGNHPAGDGSFLMTLDTYVAHLELAKQIRVSVGVARRDGDRVVLPIEWHAEPARWLFPRFAGALEWQPLSFTHGQLTLVGGYEIPLGVVGAALDATVLRDVAHRTADHLVERLADELRSAAKSDWAAGESLRRGGPLRVRDVMTGVPLVLDESLPMRTAALILFHADIGGAPVVAADGALLGVLSERDLLSKEADEPFGWSWAIEDEDRRRQATTAGEGCTSPARVTSPESRLRAAVREMLDHDVSRLVVVAGGRVVGLLTRHDALAALIRDDHELLVEVRRQLDERGARDVEAWVEWGHVTLRGTLRLRTEAHSLSRTIASIDGVADVDLDKLLWLEDDVLPTVPRIPV